MKPFLTSALLDPSYFSMIKEKTLKLLQPKEHLFLSFSAEASQFIRINGARVRQIGTVEDAQLDLEMVFESSPGKLHTSSAEVTLKGVSYQDLEEIQRAIELLRSEIGGLPEDPYAELPKNHGSSSVIHPAQLLDIEDAPKMLLSSLEKTDLAGIYAAGPCVRAMANSAGLMHWFSSNTFTFDYSLYTPSQRAVKGTFAGRDWKQADYEQSVAKAREKLRLLDATPRKIPRGNYRTYLEPAAAGDLVQMFSWGALSEASIQQADSPLRKLRNGEQKFSKKFTMSEDFKAVDAPKFNEKGELAPDVLTLIDAGTLRNTLVCTRTAKEYKVAANGASEEEGLRAPAVAAGTLAEKDILSRLGTGLYLSNLHYLNWSDQPNGRITGMTRYACFWVENGEIVAPIENLRFDDSVFSLFGAALEDLTATRTYLPEVTTYHQRHLGGAWSPGMLLSEMKFTL